MLANDSDPNGDKVTIAGFTGGQGAKVEVADGKLVYTYRPDFSGVDVLTYTIDDGKGGQDTTTVTLTVDQPRTDPGQRLRHHHPRRVGDHRRAEELYAKMLEQFIQHKIFPGDIEAELISSLQNPAASTCAEDGLLRILRKYDAKESHHRLVEELAMNALFRTSDGRVFKKGEKLRKRFKCVEVKTSKVYLFSPVYEVELV